MIDLPPNVQAYRTKRGIQYRFIPPHGLRGKMKSVTLGFNIDKAIKIGKALNIQAGRMLNGGAKEVAGLYQLGTFSHLAFEYLSSRYFMQVSANTQRTFRGQIRFLINFKYKGIALGDWQLPLITSREADKIITAIEDEVGWPSVVAYYSKLRHLFYVGIRLDMVDRNPFAKMSVKLPLPRGVFWTKDQVADVIAYCKQNDIKDFSLYFRLMYETAMRSVDVINLRTEDFDFATDPVTVFSTQQKTGTPVEIPVSYELGQDVLDFCRPSGLLFMPNRTRDGAQSIFLEQFNKIKADIDIPDNLMLRDLRRTAALEAAENGATDRELIALTGHNTPKMLRVYAPRTLKQAAEAQKKRGVIHGPVADN